jgi:hypothetical protein
VPDALAAGFASAGVAALGLEGMHHLGKSRAVGASAIRSQVSQNPTLAYLVALPGVTAITSASAKGATGPLMALVIVGSAAFTWIAWEAVILVVSKSQLAYRLVTHWELRATRARLRSLESAERSWQDRTW